jgi:hypothetical protein
MSKEFTQKERDLLALMNQADDLVTQLRDATRNKDGFYDTIHPLASTVGALAWKIEEMQERMQFVK